MVPSSCGGNEKGGVGQGGARLRIKVWRGQRGQFCSCPGERQNPFEPLNRRGGLQHQGVRLHTRKIHSEFLQRRGLDLNLNLTGIIFKSIQYYFDLFCQKNQT